MRFPKTEKKRQLIDPILPLINVVFLLLIFVMMMSRVEGTDGYDVKPPVSTSEDPAGTQERILILTEEGDIQLNGMDINESSLLKFAQDQKRDAPNQIVKIKADADVDAMKLISLMEKLRIGGIENLVLLTEKGN
ncbi:MAG: ExbD/TolR family protein [Gammaproteobacteria bacterium]